MARSNTPNNVGKMARALSKAVKAHKTAKKTEERMKHALEACQHNALKPKDKQTSLRKLAELHGVNKDTLSQRLAGNASIHEFNATKQKLTPKEERVLLAFYDRHHDELQTHWTKGLDRQRAQSLNAEAVADWFELDIYGMDESGFVTSDTGKQKVFGRCRAKVQHKQGGADHEITAAIVTICADGTVLKPTLIFKGKNMQKKFGENNVAGASYVAYQRPGPSSANTVIGFACPRMGGQTMSWHLTG
ncbi:hypothetical protein C8R44DRAFT_743455 [Mycena epipterygia]|nr:hypothetical protein C8R44DRAFT_743455 [Mycena epipterygia]